MSVTEELIAAVRERAARTPYAVVETPEGFDVRLESEDPQWFGQLREWRLTQWTVHHVRVKEASRVLTVTDELRTLSWRAGTDGRERPTLGAALEVASGRFRNRSVRRTYSAGRHGITKESETTFDSDAGRRLVLDAGQALGWRFERGVNERIGLYVGVVTVVLLVLAGVVVGVVALTGGFS